MLPLFLSGQGLVFVRSNPTVHFLAEVGLSILLFEVGLEADIRVLAHAGPSALLVAFIGVVPHLGLGWAVAA